MGILGWVKSDPFSLIIKKKKTIKPIDQTFLSFSDLSRSSNSHLSSRSRSSIKPIDADHEFSHLLRFGFRSLSSPTPISLFSQLVFIDPSISLSDSLISSQRVSPSISLSSLSDPLDDPLLSLSESLHGRDRDCCSHSLNPLKL